MQIDSYDKLYLPGDTQELTDRSIANPKGNPTKVGNPSLNKSRWVNNSGPAYQTNGNICSNTGVKQCVGKPMTANNTYITTNKSKFGNSSGYFPGSSGYNITTPTSSDFNFSTSDFTMEFWAWQPSFKTTNTHIIHSWSSDPNSFSVYFDNYNNTHPGAPLFTLMINQSLWPSCSTCWALQTWNHFAVVRTNGVTLLFVNGILKLTYNTTYIMPTFTTQSLFIGSWYNGGDVYLGYLDELRISDVARYTTDFVPQAQIFVPDSNTKLLLHMEGNNNQTYFIDSSLGEPSTPTNAYGYFDGSSYLTFPDSPDWYFGTDPFTVDFRVNFSSLPVNNSNYCLYTVYTNASTRFSIDLSCSNDYHSTVKYNNQYMPHVASSTYNGAATNVSNGSTSDYWQTNINTNQWISIDIGISKSIWKICITGYSSYSTRVPKNFRIEGSSDNSNWITTYSGITVSNSSIDQFFVLPSLSDPYRYWRFYMIDNWGDSFLLVSKFELYISTPTDIGNVYKLNFNPNDVTVMSTTWSGIQVDNWYHFALVRSGLTDTRMYIDGTQLGDTFTTNYTVADASSLLVIGASITYTLKFNGYLDELRISDSVARWTNNFTPSASNYTTDYYTKLLLHFDNPYNPTIVVDDSKIMAVNNYTSAVYLNGTNYLYMANANDYNFGNSDFTIELWYCPLYLPPANQWRGLIVKRNTWSSRHCYSLEHDAGNTIGFYWSYDGVNPTGASPIASGLVLGQWYHISVNRRGNSCFTSINGVVTIWPNIFTGSIYYSNDQLNIGKLGVGDSSSVMTGYLTDIHISKGIARYTENFIPPITYRVVDQYSKLALRFNDYSGSTYFYDYYEPGYLPGYGSTYFFSGSSCNCYWGDSADWYLGTGDFTIEFFFRRNAHDPIEAQKVLQQWASTSSAWMLYFSINSITISIWSGPVSWSIAWPNYDDNWHHIAIIRDALNSVKAYIDGIQIGTTASGIYTIPDVSASLYLGGVNAETQAFNGWLTNFRISKGIARYTSNFSSPTPLYNSIEADTNTKLLLHFDSDFSDSSIYNYPITTVGGVSLSNTQSKFGMASGYFSDKYNYLSIVDSPDWYFNTGDFTIDFWAKTTSNIISGKNIIYIQNNKQTNTEIALCINKDNVLFYAINNGTVVTYITGNAYSRVYPLLSDGNWHHIAIVRNGTNSNCINIYVDGIALVLTILVDLSSGSLPDCNGIIKIGGTSEDIVPGWLNGWLYRKSFSLSSPFGGVVNNYQMKLFLGESSGSIGAYSHCNGLCLSNFNDIRFTNSNGTTLLDYWIESISGYTPNQLATIWIEFDSIGILDTTFYMYYGNLSATSLSNGNNTFIKFDDFERGTNDDTVGGIWTEEVAHVHISTEQKYQGDKSAKFLGMSGNWSQVSTSFAPSELCSIQFRIYKEAAARVYPLYYGNGTRRLYHEILVDGSLLYYNSSGSTVDTGVNIDNDTWNLIEFNNISWSAFTYDIWLNGTKVKTGAQMNTSSGASGKILIIGDGAATDRDMWIDNFIVRNWMVNEPIWGMWDSSIYLDEFRISKGIARWTNNFLPATKAYNSVSPIKRPLCVYSGDIKEIAIGDSVAISGEKQLSYAPYLNVDFISCDVQSIILTNNTLINLSNISNGKFYRLIVTQDNIGGHTMSFIDTIKWPQGIYPSLSTISGSTDIYIFIKSRNVLYGDYVKNF